MFFNMMFLKMKYWRLGCSGDLTAAKVSSKNLYLDTPLCPLSRGELLASATKFSIRWRHASYNGSRMLIAANRNAPEPQVGSSMVMPCLGSTAEFLGSRLRPAKAI